MSFLQLDSVSIPMASATQCSIDSARGASTWTDAAAGQDDDDATAVTQRTSHTSAKISPPSQASPPPTAMLSRSVASGGDAVTNGTGSIPLATAAVGCSPPDPEHPSVRFDRAALLDVDETLLNPVHPDGRRHQRNNSRGKGVPGAHHVKSPPDSLKKEKEKEKDKVFYGAHFDPEEDPRGSVYPEKDDSDRLFVVDKSDRSLSVGGFSCASVVCGICVVSIGVVAAIVGVHVSKVANAGSAVSGAVHSAHLQSPPETLALLCSEESIATPWGYDACRDVCKRAACCEIPAGTPGSCIVDSADDCAIYQVGCALLYDITVPPPPKDLVTMCNAEALTTDEGYTRCNTMCSRAKCCNRKSGELGACHVEHTDDCAIYDTACSFLSDATVPQPPEDLTSICSPRNIATDEGFEQCHEICARASCCNRPADDPSLCKDKNTDTCAMYEVACSFLPYITVPDPPRDIIETCSPDKLDNYEGYRKCHGICEEASCCALPVGDAARCVERDDNIDKCVMYQTACSFMRDVKVPPPPNDIVASCAPENIAVMTGYNKCEDLCSLAPCCLLPPDDIGSCIHANGDACAVYQTACGALDDIGSFESYLLSICTEEKVKTKNGYEECKQGCDSADCCFLPFWHADSCSYNRDKCEQYANACYVLDDAPPAQEQRGKDESTGSTGAPMVDIPQAPINLFEACSTSNMGTSSGLDECKDLCAAAECCEASGEDSCLEENHYTCAQYTPCSVLLDGSTELSAQGGTDSQGNGDSAQGGGMEPTGSDRERDDDRYEEIAALVAEACEDDFATESEFCKKFCKPYMCCFADSRKNCQREMGSLCDAHAPCAALVGIWDDSSEGRDI